MSDVISVAVAALGAKMAGGFTAGVAKFVIPGEGAIMADADGVRVACGQGQLRLTLLQRPGGKRLNAADFLHGCPLQPGQSLKAG